MDGLEGVLAAVEYVRKKQQEQSAATRPAPGPVAPPPTAPAAQPRPPAPPSGNQGTGPGFPAAARPAAPRAAGPLQAMFEDGNSLLRALVASEILGPPIALRESYERPNREHRIWNQSPNEP